MLPRPGLLASLKSLFLDNEDNENDDEENLTCFEIVGPSGTSNTTIVICLCNIFPEGVLYHEITETENFMELLAEEAGMKTKPMRVFDLMLSHITDSCVHYHRLPECPLKVTSLVMAITFM